ncbi:MAG: amino acid ABC transporter substrate-binding protein [Burkholderiales bacterium]|nr:amino acid ABC transporter substrate-binding protein [Burkholderiales bacterium]
MNRPSNLHRPLRGLLLAAALAFGATSASLAAGVLDKVRESGKLSLGYRADTRPFAYAGDGGKAAGFSVALCQTVADAVKAELKLPALEVEFVPVTAANRFDLLQQGRIAMSCGTDTPTLERRAVADFSIPIFMAGIGAVMRIDGDRRVREVLAGQAAPTQPIWRGNPGELGESVTFAVVGGTTIEKDLLDALRQRRVVVTVAKVADYGAGVRMVVDRGAAALFGDRPVLADAAQRGAAAGQLQLIERSFSRETLALALPRGDDAFRLLVDRTLSRLYRSKEMAALYTAHFGAPGAGGLEFFQSVALPD